MSADSTRSGSSKVITVSSAGTPGTTVRQYYWGSAITDVSNPPRILIVSNGDANVAKFNWGNRNFPGGGNISSLTYFIQPGETVDMLFGGRANPPLDENPSSVVRSLFTIYLAAGAYANIYVSAWGYA